MSHGSVAAVLESSLTPEWDWVIAEEGRGGRRAEAAVASHTVHSSSRRPLPSGDRTSHTVTGWLTKHLGVRSNGVCSEVRKLRYRVGQAEGTLSGAREAAGGVSQAVWAALSCEPHDFSGLETA